MISDDVLASEMLQVALELFPRLQHRAISNQPTIDLTASFRVYRSYSLTQRHLMHIGGFFVPRFFLAQEALYLEAWTTQLTKPGVGDSEGEAKTIVQKGNSYVRN